MNTSATRKAYPTDLSDKEWALLEPFLPPPKHTGRKRKYELREIANAIFAIFYLLRTGCPWRMLPSLTTFLPGKQSTSTSENGATLECGSNSTTLSVPS